MTSTSSVPSSPMAPGAGTQTSPWHSPSGLASHPVRVGELGRLGAAASEQHRQNVSGRRHNR